MEVTASEASALKVRLLLDKVARWEVAGLAAMHRPPFAPAQPDTRRLTPALGKAGRKARGADASASPTRPASAGAMDVVLGCGPRGRPASIGRHHARHSSRSAVRASMRNKGGAFAPCARIGPRVHRIPFQGLRCSPCTRVSQGKYLNPAASQWPVPRSCYRERSCADAVGAAASFDDGSSAARQDLRAGLRDAQ